MTIQADCITFHIDIAVKLVTGNHVNPYTHNWCTQTQLQKFNISSPNRDPCVAISQRTMHNAPCCVRVRMPSLSGFFSDLYSNAVILIQDCFLP